MKYILILFSFFIFSSSAFSQIWKNSVQFKMETQKQSDTEYSIVITANITKNWHVFSKIHDNKKSDGIGLPAEMSVKGNGFKTVGNFTETPKAIPHKDEFGISQILENKAVFSQKIKRTKGDISGIAILEGQVCSDTEGYYPFKVEYDLTIQ